MKKTVEKIFGRCAALKDVERLGKLSMKASKAQVSARKALGIPETNLHNIQS